MQNTDKNDINRNKESTTEGNTARGIEDIIKGITKGSMKVMAKGFKKVGRAAFGLAFPPVCPICDRPVSNGQASICTNCLEKLQRPLEPTCLCCGKMLEIEVELCYDCASGKRSFDGGRCAFLNDETIKPALYRLKYHHRADIARALAAEVAESLKRIIGFWQPDCLIPIPISTGRRRKRGYNQAELLARVIADQLGLVSETRSLRRIKKTAAQKELTKEERHSQMRGAFQVTGWVPRTVVLVDDIYTTGATVDAAAAELKKNGAERVYFLCVCQGEGV